MNNSHFYKGINQDKVFRLNFFDRFRTFHEVQLEVDQGEAPHRTSCSGRDSFLPHWVVARTYLRANCQIFPCHEHVLHF